MNKNHYTIVDCSHANDHARQEICAAIRQALIRYNRSYHPGPPAAQLLLTVQNSPGTIGGGLVGYTSYRWLHIHLLWLDEALRGHGFGSRLLIAAEDAARKQCCAGIHLDTFSFQAPGFYRYHGYTEFGRLENYPPGATRLFFKKEL